MTQSEALQSLITFAPSWYHSVEYRIAYIEGKIEERYNLFTSEINKESTRYYVCGPDLSELLASAKNFIYLTRIEQTLTQSCL